MVGSVLDWDMEFSHGFLVHLDPEPGSESVVINLVFDANIIKIILVFDVNIIKNHHRTVVTIISSATDQ